ncbi:MAG: beta-ketoacyl synthase N-terminal-like domain-containing protein, partial [Gemmataceae bacterium]
MPDSAPTPLAVIGLGCLFPGSSGRAGFWANVVDGADAIRPVPESHWRAADYLDADPKTPDKVYAARGGFLDPVAFPPADFGIAPTNLEATDSSQLLGLLVAQQALDDCGYAIQPAAGKKPVDRARVSVILGVTGTLQLVIPLGARLGHPLWRKALREAGVEDAVADDVVARISDGYVPWQENSFPGLLGNVVAGRIANRLDLGGTNCVVDAACASSLGAVHLAGMELATGRADIVLTGGVDCFNDIFMFTCFSKTPALSPTGNARPFDAEGDGTVLGEGLGVVVLKRLGDARRDGDRIYAVLKGIGSSSDGKGGAIYAPRREGQTEALRNAYRDAGVSPATVELVEAHGTGTKVGDATEIQALSDVYRAAGRQGTWAAVGSIKSQIGHTKAAAGAAGLIKAALALYHKVLPPTIKVTKPLDVLRDGPLYANTVRRPWMPSADHPRRAALSAFGFGGSNFHCVLEEADAAKPEIDWCGDAELLAFSGTEAEVVKQLDAPPPLSAFRADAAVRVVIACRKADVAKKVAQARAMKPGDGVFIGRGPAAGKLAVLFPGQGAQYAGMLRELVCHFPPAFDAFVRADAAFTAAAGRRLVDLAYPVPAFDDAARQRQEAALRATDAAQPALGAVQIAAWRVLEHFGVRAEAFAGHSYGELVALCAAGRIAEDDLARLSLVRGRLMADAGKGDAGAMLAVKASEAAIAEVLREEKLDLVLANKNAPEQTVLSGPTPLIERAKEAFTRRKVGCAALPVAAAFHSPLVAAAREPFAKAMAGVKFAPGLPVYANSTAQPYPDDGRELLAGQLARPVEWVRSLEAMHAAGCRDFLEAGAGGKLTPLAEATLSGVSCHALDRKGGFLDIAATLAWLASRGHGVRLDLWRPAEPVPAKKPGMTVQLSGVNYVKPREPRPARPRPAAVNHVSSNGTPKATMTQPTPPVPDNSALAQALALTRESLATLQRMQEQQAALHRQFLDGQDAAHRTMAVLIDQQQRLLTGAPAAALPPMPAYAPPVAVAVTSPPPPPLRF